MVGKHMHKKKMSEYTENEDYKSDADGGDDDVGDKEYRVSGSDGSENGDAAKNDVGGKTNERDDDEETTLGEDDDLAQGLNSYSHGDGDDGGSPAEDNDDDEDYGADNAKKSKKRKTAGAKKSLDTNESDDEALNGVSPKKKGRKSGKAGGAAAKTPAKGKAKAKKAAPVDDEEEDDGGEEEEYEVKDIVGHKTERGVSYFLIRWKGYTKADDTWEAEDSLNCPDIIEKYKKKQAAATSPKKGATPASKKGKKGAAVASAAKGNKNAKKQNDADEDDDEEQEWEVEKIIDYAEEKKGRVFRIRWKGFGPKHDTWEPEANLNCKDIIDKFMKRMKSEENVSFKELREEPKKTKRLVNETAPRTNIHNPIGRKSKRGGNKQRVYYGEDD